MYRTNNMKNMHPRLLSNLFIHHNMKYVKAFIEGGGIFFALDLFPISGSRFQISKTLTRGDVIKVILHTFVCIDIYIYIINFRMSIVTNIFV